MKKNIFLRVLLCCASVMILLGVALTVYVYKTAQEREMICVDLKGGQTESVEFQDLSLSPGEQSQYTISLKKGEIERYEVSLHFEATGSATIAKYTDVRVEMNGELLCERKLSECFNDEALTFDCDFSDQEKYDVTVIYSMPKDVGNEAQNAQADFVLNITASNMNDE